VSGPPPLSPGGGEREALERAAARLEDVARRIGDPSRLGPGELRELAEQALALTGEITERIPRVLREGEDRGG
jgi:hypothetical protein